MIVSSKGCSRRGCISRVRDAADCGGGEQTAHVLNDDEPGAELVDRFGHVRPETGTSARCEASHLPDGRDILTGEPAAENIHRRHGAPVNGGDIAEVRGILPMVGEDTLHGADLGEPHRAGMEYVLDGEIEAPIAGEQRPDTQRLEVGGRGGVFSHRGSR